jgi:prepilin signal peptidase PulO-like enzyme (type II secretory pathway)
MWKMSEMSEIVGMLVLVYFTVVDIRTRTIPTGGLVLAQLMVSFFIFYQWFAGEIDIYLLIGGVTVGLVFLFISHVTREGIGYGDSWMILILGTYLGLWKLLEVLTWAFLGLALVSMGILALKKMSRKSVVPFVPFLAAGYLLTMILAV